MISAQWIPGGRQRRSELTKPATDGKKPDAAGFLAKLRLYIESMLKDTLSRKWPDFYFGLLTLRSHLSTLSRGSLIRKYLESTPHPKLQLGSGRTLMKGWLNTDFFAKHPDFIYVNVTHAFPLPSNVFERVYSEHMIEHITKAHAEVMLAESFRVLKPGGRIRLETPDLEKISNLYAARNEPDAQKYFEWHHMHFGDSGYPPTICFAINSAMRSFRHLFLYDGEMLRLMLEKAGFRDFKQYSWNESDDPEFQNISIRKGVGGTEYETVVVEATKPG